jgi:pyrophosphate--fructose-6-phosphate 1-phosphotransferase
MRSAFDGEVSALERLRRSYRPHVPELLRRDVGGLSVAEGPAPAPSGGEGEIARRFPRTSGRPSLRLVGGGGPARRRALAVGVVLSGGQAPGGHNVITGLFDRLREVHRESRLHGFLGGPRGIFDGARRLLERDELDAFRNTGGFDLIGSGRDKIESPEQLAASAAAVRELELDGLVVIGGDDSNTNAAVLAEYFLEQGLDTAVLGVPKTIDGDLKGGPVEASFGFDTATKVYSELIGNICRDARSAAKYWHFIRLMGRSASHVTLECALQTRPNIALIGEEVRRNDATLTAVVDGIAEIVRSRAAEGRSYGVCLVPEGLIEFVPEMRTLIDELNGLLSAAGADGAFEDRRAAVAGGMGEASRAVFTALPERIQRQLLLDRDSHGNVRVSQIDTELLLTEQVARRVATTGAPGVEFRVQSHFFGYEGRCAAPSNFDADYTYGLGRLAATLIAFERSGYICGLGNLALPRERWIPQAAPLTSMMQIETRKGRPTPVIAKALVDLDGAPFGSFRESRDAWAREDAYRFPGAIQYFGPDEVAASTTATLQLEHGVSEERS